MSNSLPEDLRLAFEAGYKAAMADSRSRMGRASKPLTEVIKQETPLTLGSLWYRLSELEKALADTPQERQQADVTIMGDADLLRLSRNKQASAEDRDLAASELLRRHGENLRDVVKEFGKR